LGVHHRNDLCADQNVVISTAAFSSASGRERGVERPFVCPSRASANPLKVSPLHRSRLGCLPDFPRLSTMNVYPQRWGIPRNL
jgi:hypothetical protein